MRNTMMHKIVGLAVAILFFANDICFGLGTMPASVQPEKRAEILQAAGGKLFARAVSGALNFDRYSPQNCGFVGGSLLESATVGADAKGPDRYKTEFVKCDYNELPEGWENNPILQQTDVIEALKMFRKRAGISKDKLEIIEGWYPLKKDGQLSIAQIETLGSGKHVLVIHTKFVQMWNDIRNNDVWFEADIPDSGRRTISVAWGIFYRLARHEMAELSKRDGTFKSFGHFGYYEDDLQRDETLANLIGGNYSLFNDAIWMWFLGSYSIEKGATRYNNQAFLNRIRWFFDSEDARKERLDLEFPNLLKDIEKRKYAIALAHAINYNYFGRDDIKAADTNFVNPKFIKDYNEREAARAAAGITKKPLLATGSGETPAQAPGASIIGNTDENSRLSSSGISETNSLGYTIIASYGGPVLYPNPKEIIGTTDITIRRPGGKVTGRFTVDAGYERVPFFYFVPKSRYAIFFTPGPGDRTKMRLVDLEDPKAAPVVSFDERKHVDFKHSPNERYLALYSQTDTYILKATGDHDLQLVLAKKDKFIYGDDRDSTRSAVRFFEDNRHVLIVYPGKNRSNRAEVYDLWGSSTETPVMVMDGFEDCVMTKDELYIVCLTSNGKLASFDVRNLSAPCRTHKAFDSARYKFVGSIGRSMWLKDGVIDIDCVIKNTMQHEHFKIPLQSVLPRANAKKVTAAAPRLSAPEDRRFSSSGAEEKPETTITFEDIKSAIEDINRVVGASAKSLFKIPEDSNIAKKVLGLPLRKGKKCLVVGPGATDYLPIVLAKLGLDTTSIDTGPGEIEYQVGLYRDFGLEDRIKAVSSYDDIEEGETFDYIFILGALHEALLDNPVLSLIESIQREILSQYSMPVRSVDSTPLDKQSTYTMWLNIEPVIKRLNPDGGYIFVNDYSPYRPEELEASSGEPYYLKMLRSFDEALKSHSTGLGVEFVRQPEIDIDDFTLNMVHYAEERKGIVYRAERAGMGNARTSAKTKTPNNRLSSSGSEHQLIRIISEYTVPLAAEKGPGIIKMSETELTDMYKAVTALHEGEQLEIILPKNIGISEAMKRALLAANNKHRSEARNTGKGEERDMVTCRIYSDEDNLKTILEQNADPKVKRIVITDKAPKDEAGQAKLLELARANAALFKDTRLLNISLPEGYGDMKQEDKTFHQAHIMMIAILARLLESDSDVAKMTLRAMLDGYIDGDVGEFVENLAKSDDSWSAVDKIRYFLGRAVSLLPKFAAEFELMKLRMNTFYIAL